MMRLLSVSVLVLALAGLSSAATAQTLPGKPAGPVTAPGGEPSADEARTLFEEGTALLNAGRFKEAEAKLRFAWAKRKTYDVAGNLGTALLQLGKHAEAAQMFAHALDSFPAGGSPKEKKWVEDLLADARKEVVLVRVRVNVEAADVFVNGELLGKSPAAPDTYAPAGVVVVEVKKPGFEDARVEQKGAKGGTVEATVAMKPKSEPPPGGAGGARKELVIGGGVLAGAALVAGGVLFGVSVDTGETARAKKEDLLANERSCVAGASNFDARCPQIEEDTRTADTLNRAAIGVWIGAAAVAAGTALYVLWPRAKASASGLRVSPAVSAAGGAFVVSGEW